MGALVSIPYAAAELDPPAGRAFVGTFHWVDDVFNYLSFVQQAEDGRLLFRNKLNLEDDGGRLVNVEWTIVGWISRACGRRPFLAYRIFALAALAGLLGTADRALRRLGLPPSHRFPALILVALGGGLGGLLFEFTARDSFRSADIYVAFYPFLEALANPHWLAATWLLLESLLAFASDSRRGPILGIALGTVLGLVRPYDLVLLAGAHAVAVAATSRPADWLRRGLPLAGLLPVIAYNYSVFYASPTFRTYGSTSYASPPASDLLWSLGPAALVALAGLRRTHGDDPSGRLLRAQLWAWAVLAPAIVCLRPTSFALQFAVGAGVPLLLLAVLTLERLRPPVFLAAALVFSTSSVVALRIVLQAEPHWYVPAEKVNATLQMRATCRPGDLAFAPEDIGLYTLGLTSCHPFVSHPWEPGHADRQAVAAAFYTTLAPGVRTEILDRVHARHLVLPGDPGPVPEAWLGAATAFRRSGRVGEGDAAISLYSR